MGTLVHAYNVRTLETEAQDQHEITLRLHRQPMVAQLHLKNRSYRYKINIKKLYFMWGASTIGGVLTVQALAPVCGSLASTRAGHCLVYLYGAFVWRPRQNCWRPLAIQSP